jgi:hypothetical protein
MAEESYSRFVSQTLRGQDVEQSWRGILEAASRSHLTQSEYCRRRSLSPALYFWWRGEIARRDAKRDRSAAPAAKPATFLPVRVVPRSHQAVAKDLPSAEAPLLEVLLGRNRRVAVRPGFDRETLERLL